MWRSLVCGNRPTRASMEKGRKKMMMMMMIVMAFMLSARSRYKCNVAVLRGNVAFIMGSLERVMLYFKFYMFVFIA